MDDSIASAVHPPVWQWKLILSSFLFIEKELCLSSWLGIRWCRKNII